MDINVHLNFRIQNEMFKLLFLCNQTKSIRAQWLEYLFNSDFKS